MERTQRASLTIQVVARRLECDHQLCQAIHGAAVVQDTDEVLLRRNTELQLQAEICWTQMSIVVHRSPA